MTTFRLFRWNHALTFHRRMTTACVVFCLVGCTEVVGAQPGTSSPASLERLLRRIDSAPVSWRELEMGARRGDELARCASLTSSLTAPLLPGLKRAAQSRSLGLLGRVPIAGAPARAALGALEKVIALDEGLEQLVHADRKHLAPLRRAAQSGARLQHSRSAHDTAAVARDFAEAARALEEDERLAYSARARLSALSAMWQVVSPLAARYSPPGSRRAAGLAGARTRIHQVTVLLDSYLSRMSATRRWLREGANEALSNQH